MVFLRYILILPFIYLFALPGCAKITPPAERIMDDERVELRVIVVPTLEQAEEVQIELKGGKPFWALAQDRSVHPSNREGGFLGSVRKRELGKEYQKALEGLKEGDYSSVFKTGDGYYGILQKTTTRYFKDALELYLAGSLDKAEEEFMKDLSLNPDNIYSYISLGIIYDKRGDFERAIEMYKSAIELDPTNEMSYNNLATTYFNLDRPKAAIETFKKALEIAPDSASIKNNLAWVYASEGINLDEGITMMKAVIEKEPGSTQFRETLSELYYKKGMYDDALREIRKAIEIEPDKEALRAQLKKIEDTKNRRLQPLVQRERLKLDMGLKDEISEETPPIKESTIVAMPEGPGNEEGYKVKMPVDKKVKKDVHIKVLIPRKGAERDVIIILKKMGYRVSMVGKAEKLYPHTTIYFRKGFRDVAERISQNLKGRNVIKPLTWKSVFNIIILVGK